MFTQQLINGLALGSVYALIALGYTMVYGILQLINFAHGEVYMLGAYLGIIVLGILTYGGVTAYSLPLSLLLAVIISMAFCAAYGAVIERVAYRPLRNAPKLAPLISAVGMSIILQNFVMLAQGKEYKNLPLNIVYRGLGGAGFPVGLKWSTVPAKDKVPKPHYVVANADASEPGCFKDRVLMERSPHSVLEGALIAGHAMDADAIFIFIRGEYLTEYEILAAAVEEARAAGLLGEIDIVVHRGAGAVRGGRHRRPLPPRCAHLRQGLPRHRARARRRFCGRAPWTGDSGAARGRRGAGSGNFR